MGKNATKMDFTVFGEHFAKLEMMDFPDFVSLAITLLVLPIAQMHMDIMERILKNVPKFAFQQTQVISLFWIHMIAWIVILSVKNSRKSWKILYF